VSASPTEYDELNISFQAINIVGVGEKIQVTGYGTYPVQTEFHNISFDETINYTRNITIKTRYPESWEIFLNQTIANEDTIPLVYAQDYWINETQDGIKLEFREVDPTVPPESGDFQVRLRLRIVNIYTQIGPGWIQ
jgi:hypothetical protein